MDFNTVVSRVADLPNPFKRPDQTYAAWEQAQSEALANYTLGVDGLSSQASFSTALLGWLDVWGLLFGIVRLPNESDAAYQARIKATLANPVGTLYGIQIYGAVVFGAPVEVQENLSGLGYTITLPANLSSTAISNFLTGLERIRPLGVPFQIVQQVAGSFLNTYCYLGATRIGGVYLNGVFKSVPLSFGASTNNTQPILPGVLLTDPLLNGQVTL